MSTLAFASACGGGRAGGAVRVGNAVRAASSAADGHVIYMLGGDSRGDSGHVLDWAFDQARAVSANGFLFLGDMEWSRKCDPHFADQVLRHLGGVPLYPVLGNHEVLWFGGKSYGAEKEDRIIHEWRERFLHAPGIELPPACDLNERHRVFYSVDLPSGGGERRLHFVALDNVSERGLGKAQLDWLREDLIRHADARWTIVGMHKPLAGNCTGDHSMAEDGPVGRADSDALLSMLAGDGGRHRPVSAIFASHDHYYAHFDTPAFGVSIPTYVTGGLGAHLKSTTCEEGRSFHHFLQLDVSPGGFSVTPVAWSGPQSRVAPGARDDEDEDEGQALPDPACAMGAPRSQGRSPSAWASAARVVE
jgi:hypothetical protein